MTFRNFTDTKTLLFDNLTVKQTIFKNTFWLALGNGGSRLFRLILLIYVAGILGATEYGKFTFALAFIFLFQVFADFGIFNIAIREFAQEKEKEKDFSSLLTLKILLSIGVLFLIFALSFFITQDPVVRKIIFILAISNIISTYFLIFYAVFHARQKMEYDTLIRVLESLFLLGAGFFVLFYFPSILNLSLAYLFSSVVGFFILLLLFNFKFQRIKLSINRAVWKKYLIMSWPLALIGGLSVIYNQIDSVMMGYLGQITQTGWYNAAHRIIVMVTIPVGIIAASFYPVLSRAIKETKEKLQKVWEKQMEVMILLAVPLMVAGITLAPKIINYIFGLEFAPSIFAFQILLLTAGMMFLYSSFHWILVIVNQQKKLFWAVLLGAIVNVILNLILIPQFSLYGAAISTAITHFLILFLLIRFTLKFTTINPFNLKLALSFVGAVICSIPMYFVIIQPSIYYLNVILTVLIGAGIYSICFVSYRKLIDQILLNKYAQ